MRKFSQMSFADLAADDEIFSGFSAFNSVEEPEEEVSSEEDEGDELSEDLEETPKKKPAKAAKKKVSKGPELDGPVKVQGTGWTFTHGVGGEKYFAWDVLKAAYEAGYLEVANSLVRFSVDGSVIFV